MSTSIFDLSGKRAVVTGGASGIGLGIARALADYGADVCLWGRTKAKLDLAAESLAGTVGQVSTRRVDVADEGAVAVGMDAAAGLGNLDIVVVNAGVVLPTSKFPASTTADFRATQQVNLEGAYFTLREASRVMVAQTRNGGFGASIIAISSLAAVHGASHNQAYAASKAGLLAMANGAAVELARHGIRVNTILPGWVATDMTTGAQESQTFSEKVISRVPMRRWGSPSDVAGAAVYLASDASSYQTGSSMVIDGGYSMF